MAWQDAVERGLETFSQGMAYHHGFRDALRGEGRNPRYLRSTALRSEEEVANYDRGYRDGIAERVLKGGT